MLAEKNKEMQNLTETMQKKIDSINEDRPASSPEGKEQIQRLEELVRKYEGQIL